jgi:hypothetical protein
MTSPDRISRKELATLLGVSVYVVRKNEKRHGLDKVRADVNRRVVGYRRAESLQILRERGLL